MEKGDGMGDKGGDVLIFYFIKEGCEGADKLIACQKSI